MSAFSKTDHLGKVAFDSGANRLQNYVFHFLPNSNGRMSTALNVVSESAPCDNLVCFRTSKGKTTTENLSNKRRTIESYALMGSAKAEFICLKQDKRIRWTKDQQKFLFELKSLNHENLTNFLGICCNEDDRFYILHTLVERASLEDFIFDHEFNMDATFRSAFIKDIIKVNTLKLISFAFLFFMQRMRR
ncbi:unnamed protein product [Toxocara canis]|uniref:PK_Tyr_Ser-Thr domain-containing protein n=1 Tax=Toxocara canis TaxID=6265 RepID=A0A183V1H0_TOXCA|nr:unnamed protein product [Toxocara canis]